VFLRRAFYRLTLDHCDESFFIGFGAIFSNRHSRVEQDAYVGPYAVIGSTWLRRGCLIGTRSSIVSGTGLHSQDSQGRWMPTDVTHPAGRDRRTGAAMASIVMATSDRRPWSAGSVVSSASPHVVVVGKPAHCPAADCRCGRREPGCRRALPFVD
jgi:hypothetical protein